ncbi:MAG: Ig-like domain-containing protein, partial [Candidatus Neomarinimicrobiota bacterium]|nr:Ig-like domain-containing protein [Candidatus Neomarinimicrobiota bacterium]
SRLVRKTIFGLRGKAPEYISYVYGLDSLKTWKDDVFTVVNYNEYEKPYLFQLFDVNAIGYANALFDYNEQGWLTRQVWKRLPDGKEMRLWNYNFDPETKLTRIMEFDSTKTLVMDIQLNPDSLEAVYNPIFPIDSGFTNSTILSFELLDSIHVGFITWRWVGGVPDIDSTHIFKIPDSLYHKRIYQNYDLILDDYLIDGAIYNIEFTGESAFDFEIIKTVIPYVTYDVTPPTISVGSKPAINKPEFYFTTDEPLSEGYIEWIPFPSTTQQDSLHIVYMNDQELNLGLRQYIILENQTPLLDSAKYNLQFTAYDRARNQSFFQAQELILYDISPPLVYMYYPLSNTYVNNLEVQVEASEFLASGQIILTDLSEVRDTLSPHIYQLPKKELELGLHAALLDDALPVLDTTTYSFKYIGIDPAGNISEPAIREPIYYDISPPIYTQIYPTIGSHVNNPRLSFIVSEDLAAGEFTWAYREGLKDTSAPHVITLIANERKGDTRTNWMLKNQTELLDGTVYDLIFIGQDLAGNQTGFITTPDITYDITLPVFTILDPIEDGYANYLSLSYEISEPLREGTITWTALNNTKDPESPRIISMELDEMVEGVFSDILLKNMTSLVDSLTYSIKIQGSDLATNIGIPFTVSTVHYDFSPPIITLTHPADNTYQSKTYLNYQITEDLHYGQVSWVRLYTRGVKPDTVILQGSELIAGVNDSITFAGMKKLKDGASYDIIFEGYDLAKNDAIPKRIANVTYDFTPPDIELQYPQTLSSVNKITISYELNEFLLEGTVTWKWVDGVLDTREHVQVLSPYEREPGQKNFILIQDAPELVDGAYYDLTLFGKDRAGNPSNKATAKNVKYDITPPVISITNPTPNIFITSTQIEYDFSEDMDRAVVKFEYSGGDYDLGSPHIYNIQGDDLKIGSHIIEPEFVPELMEGTQFTLSINGEDLAGNPAEPASVLEVVYDAYPPVLALNYPLPNSFINNSKISYSINESLLEAILIWEAVGGADDPNSPHKITFNEDEKKKGSYKDTVLTSQSILQDSTIYSVTFSGKDPAGNESNLVINDNVTYDISSPIITIIEPGNNHYTPSTNINYSSSEDLLIAKIIYVGTSGDKKRLNAEVILPPEGLLAGNHNSDEYNRADLRDSATYMIGFEARDLAGNYASPVGLYNYHIDRTLPVISIISPTPNSHSNFPLFEYSLSEDIYYGKVIFFDQSDSLNLIPVIEFELDSVEFSKGIHSLDTLINQLSLKDSTVYSIQVKVFDIAKNWNDSTVITDFHYDITQPIVNILDPIDSSFINTNAVSIYKSEDLISADMYWVNSEGNAISSRIRERDLLFGETRLVMYPTSLNENTHYDLFIIGEDLAGNSFQTNVTNGIIYDVTIPTITINKPIEGGYINTKALSYDLSEPLIQANVTWEIKTGIDTLSPYRVELQSDEMTAGNHDSTFFSYIPEIIDGYWYGLTMAGVDRAGNQSDVVIIDRAKYDFTYPIFYDLKPDVNQWIRKLDLAYTLSEDLIFGRIVFRHIGGEPDPDGEYLVRLEGSRLKAGPGGGELPRSLVRLVSGGIYSITYTGRDSADNFVSEFIIPNVRFDNIKPFIVITKPMASQTVFDSYKWPYTNSEKMNYTLSENLKESSLTIVNTGGKIDPRSPIEIQLTKDEMIEGSYIDTAFLNSVTLIDSAIYTFSFNGID